MLPFQKHVASRNLPQQFRPEMEYGLHSDLDESIIIVYWGIWNHSQTFMEIEAFLC